MADRNKARAQHSDRAANLATLPAPDEELQFKLEALRATKKNVVREWAKGILIPLAAIASISLVWRFSHAVGTWFWLGSVVFLVIMAIGLAYATEFIKLLITGKLLKQTAEVVKEAAMKEWMKVFLAFLATGGGVSVLLTEGQLDYYVPEWVIYCVGLILIAGGITFFWTRSKLYSG